MTSPLLTPTLVLGAILTCGCESPVDEASCVEPLPATCQPLYDPVFDEIHSRTFAQKCAIAGGACHTAAGAQGGLVLAGLDTAYDMLVGEGRVVPGDPACGTLVRRLETHDPAEVMPPGDPLSEPERCAIRQWIAAGAER